MYLTGSPKVSINRYAIKLIQTVAFSKHQTDSSGRLDLLGKSSLGDRLLVFNVIRVVCYLPLSM